jgi:putative acetyltransferase
LHRQRNRDSQLVVLRRIGGPLAWRGAGPIAVEPPLQRAGIGKTLIFRDLQTLKEVRATDVALTGGDPSVYRCAEFQSDGLLDYKDIDKRFVQRVVFSGPAPKGELQFDDAFEQSERS